MINVAAGPMKLTDRVFVMSWLCDVILLTCAALFFFPLNRPNSDRKLERNEKI